MSIIGKIRAVISKGCFFWFVCVWPQNEVRNPSFEEYAKCPERLGNFGTDVTAWSTPTQGSTDYFHGCSSTMGAPKNFNGTQSADFGNGYAGLYLYAPQNYREYVQGALHRRLKAGERYRVSFYLSLAERSDFAVRELGVLFSSNPLDIKVRKNLSKKLLYQDRDNQYQTVEIKNPDFYLDTKKWLFVTTEFTAKGFERFLTIGNFKGDARTPLRQTKRNAQHGAYYYLDRVEVIASSERGATEIGNAIPDLENLEQEKTQKFHQIFFRFDEFSLLEAAKKELQQLVERLWVNDLLHVTIHGHTDNVGSADYNQELSEKRAKSVAAYLIASGIAMERVSWRGHGGRRPITENNTEQGRMKNRRVEFVLTTKQ